MVFDQGYFKRIIKELSIIPAITKRGMIIKKNTLNVFRSHILNSLVLFGPLYVNIKNPSFIPNAVLKRTAGSSKIPCGRSRHITKGPSIATVLFTTKPKTYALTTITPIGTKPKKIPNINAKKEDLMLLNMMKLVSSKNPIPCVCLINSSISLIISSSKKIGKRKPKMPTKRKRITEKIK